MKYNFFEKQIIYYSCGKLHKHLKNTIYKIGSFALPLKCGSKLSIINLENLIIIINFRMMNEFHCDYYNYESRMH